MTTTRRAAIAGAVLLLAAFGLGALTTHGFGLALDVAILRGLRTPGDLGLGIGPAWFRDAVVEVTALGAPMPMLMATLLGSALLLARRRPLRALLLFAASLSGRIGVLLLKDLVARPRPTVVPALVQAASTSYPSAHAANSALVCIGVALMLGRPMTPPPERRTLLAAAILMTTLIGLSRIYLGVHWPSDVAAGWMLGAGWALLWWALARALDPRAEGRAL